MKLLIFGSRTLDDERVRIIIMEEIKNHHADILITAGEPSGVCAMARRVAQDLAVPLHLHFLNFKYLRGAYEHRSDAALNEADHAIYIHDGKSKGTANEMLRGKKFNVPGTTHILEIEDHMKRQVRDELFETELQEIGI